MGTSSIKVHAIHDAYDYVIIGGGTAGLTVGDRLSESGEYSVLVIEYGLLVPEGFVQGQTTYNITSAPSPGLNNRNFSVDVGCIVGGSSAVNGKIFQRGTTRDYDIWGELGGSNVNSSWTWNNILPYFRKGIQLTPPKPEIPKPFNLTYDAQFWGHNTSNHSIFATYGNVIYPNVFTMREALKQVPGMALPADSGAGQPGTMYYMFSTDPLTGARSYSRTGHWDGLNRTIYHLITATRANKVILEGDKVVGVQITPRGGGKNTSTIVKVNREVILSAGTIHTPQVLQLSGIGPAGLLKWAGIPVKVDLPGVGANFQDHSFVPTVSFSWGTQPPIPVELRNISLVPDGLGNTTMGVSIGLPVVSPSNFSSIAARFADQDPAAYFPNGTHPTIITGYRQQQLIYSREMRLKDFSFLRFSVKGDPTFTPVNIHPVSRGTILIDPTNPEAEPIVDYRAASNPIDIELAIAGIRFIRRLITTGKLAQYNATELVPGAEYDTDEKLGAFVRNVSVATTYHPVGTAAKMPREWGGVVDEELRIYGVEGLRVVDASIMPTIVAATTSMTVYAIAEKAADMIKAGWHE
ncbi:hypothetical protein GE09DRAFT_1179452 [Coniochaeta sp. 2T2.1]|nr:hypothetical protein GE09DRAFT_1179452 [Coniochaeta sp. 2T2.1]